MPNGELRSFPFLPLPAAEPAERSRARGGPSGIQSWGHGQQTERVHRHLVRLQDAFDRRRQELRDELAGVEPELALVIETVGSVKDFQKAVARIDGLEWLTDQYEPEMESGDDFFREGKGEDDTFGGTLYLVMSDQRAKDQMLSLWARYREEEGARFPRGLTPWREAFKHVRTIRPWGPEDRLRKTGLLEDWQNRLRTEEPMVRAQAELWFRGSEEARERQVRELRVRLERVGGRLVGQSVVIPQIAYHGCALEVPREEAAKLVADREIELLRCEGIMLLRPIGQIAVAVPEEEAADGVDEEPETLPSEEEPVVAVLDGLPLERHNLLAGRLRIDDPEGWAAEVPAGERHHGTTMGSLVVHGDLSSDPQGEPLRRPVYMRPILRPDRGAPDGAREAMPEDQLEVDLVHRAVRRILESTGDEPAAAPRTLVVNLSLGDPYRPFERQISPLARLLDWLSWKYGVLFVVSSGNPGCARRLELDCSREELREASPWKLREHVWRAMVRQADLRRVLAPAEAANAITVGGEHADDAGTFPSRDRIDPLASDGSDLRLPSPVTAFGGGVGRALKPDLLYPAGRMLYRDRYGATKPVELEASRATAVPPGQRVASPGSVPGRTDQTRYLCGTSNAAALVTRTAARLHERLPELIGTGPLDLLPERRFVVPLLKTLLVHGVSWGPSQSALQDLLVSALDEEVDRMTLGRFLGYGFPDHDRLEGCHAQRATLCGWGELGDGDGHLYRIPLPPSLNAEKVWRRLTITLAWLTPINPFDRRYRRSQIWFEPKIPGETDSTRLLGVKRTEADNRAALRGTVQHEIFEGERAAPFGDEDELSIKISCRAHAGELVETVPYALAVSLEVARGVELPIYDEMRVRLRPRAQIRP